MEQLEADEKKLESSLKGKQRSVTETISQTVKQRKEEITKSYDAELGKAQERMKKVKESARKRKIRVSGNGSRRIPGDLCGRIKNLWIR